ncbi:MAG: cyclophilin-like fold protein [Nitrososphaeria archaeon]|nr:cyclophilin-like fold protein [Nitrososphaeria archaeon]
MVSRKIIIEFEKVGTVEAEISDQINPKTFEAFVKNIPFESEANIWGKEIYFDTPVTVPIENGKRKVEVGDIAYWPPGRSMCLFFGPTPASSGQEPVAASPVNVFGKITKNIELLSKVRDGTKIVVKFA